MSVALLSPAPAPPVTAPLPEPPRFRFRGLIVAILVLAALAGVGWMGFRAWKKVVATRNAFSKSLTAA